MHDQEQISALHDVVDELLGRKSINALIRISPPFNIEKTNDHGSKEEFLAERNAIDEMQKSVRIVLNNLIAEPINEFEPQMRERLALFMNEQSRHKQATRPIANANDLVLANISTVGFFMQMLRMQNDMYAFLLERMKELDNQEEEFWKVKHRPRNYYAHSIASRMARLYVSEKAERPTYGTSSDGAHPSTSFASAVEKVFKILNIDATIRGPCQRAIKQIKDSDLREAQTALRIVELTKKADALRMPPPNPLSAFSDFNMRDAIPPSKGGEE